MDRAVKGALARAASGATVLAAVGLAAASGCGGTPAGKLGATRPAPVRPASSAPFAWLRPAPSPAGWRRVRAPDGATLPYPAGWRLVKGDIGTVTAALRDAHGRYLGYLNLTPRQGAERQTGWASFRVHHNIAEGNRHDRVLASQGRLSFRSGKGTCVQDSYVTSSGAPYMEIACLIAGRHPSVVVGAAPPDDWRAQERAIERAIDGVVV